MPPWCSIALWILFWILFWTAFAFFSLSRTKVFSMITVCVLLVVMRQQNNQLSLPAWIAFWVVTYDSWRSMFSKINTPTYDVISFILSAARWLITNGPDADGNYYQMPTTTFWILVGALALTEKHSIGDLVWQFLFLFNTYINREGIHIPGMAIRWWVVLVPLSPLILLAILAIGAYSFCAPERTLPNLPFLVAVGVFHEQMWPWNEEFGFKWLAAWFLLYHAIICVFSPNDPFRPVPWYGSCAMVVVLLGWAIRPDQSYRQFLTWAAEMWMLRLVANIVMIHYMPPTESPPTKDPPAEGPPAEDSSAEILRQYLLKLRQQGTSEFSATGRFRQPYGATRPMPRFNESFYPGGRR